MNIISVSSLLISLRDTVTRDEQVAHHINSMNRETPWTLGNSESKCSEEIEWWL